jgi:hypothetical protein
MYWIHDEKEDEERLGKEDLAKLRREGFTERSIARLCRLRIRYSQNEMDQVPLDRRRLEFARWLVATGRLTDRME